LKSCQTGPLGKIEFLEVTESSNLRSKELEQEWEIIWGRRASRENSVVKTKLVNSYSLFAVIEPRVVCSTPDSCSRDLRFDSWPWYRLPKIFNGFP